MKSYVLLIGLLAFAGAQAGELYRSIDSSGNVHYSDRPLQGSEDVEQLKSGKEPVPEVNLPYETQRAMQHFPVTLYAFPDCGASCQHAREFLNNRGIPYTEKSLTTQQDMDQFRKESGSADLPALAVGKTWLKGFLAEQWNKELDFAGYPKSNPGYRPKLAPSPAASAVPAQPAQ